MIDARNMNVEEFTDLISDLKDGKIKFNDVIWNNRDFPSEIYLQKGDIVKIDNNYCVVVSVNEDDGIFFAATADAFIYTEKSQKYTYSWINSGWEHINDKVQKVGHIMFI